MSNRLGLRQLKAWELFLTHHAKICRKIERSLEAPSNTIPFHWYDVLFVLNQAQGKKLRLSEIAEAIVTSRSALTRSIDKMEKQGLLMRQRCPSDGRGQFAVVTKKGHGALKKAWPVYRVAIHEHFGRHLSNQDAENFCHILRKLQP